MKKSQKIDIASLHPNLFSELTAEESTKIRGGLGFVRRFELSPELQQGIIKYYKAGGIIGAIWHRQPTWFR